MNLKTTLVLLLLAIAGGGCWLVLLSTRTRGAQSETLAFLNNDLTADQLTRIDMTHGDNHVVLERDAAGQWALPGNWPARRPEVEQLVGLVTSLRSRFVPIALSGRRDELKEYGLDPSQAPVLISVRAGGHDYRVQLGEEPGTSNRFSRPTYLRINDNAEVVRLAPNLVAALDRPESYYQQRRLFPAERLKEGEMQERKDQLVAKSITAKGATASYTLERKGHEWELQQPLRDRVDPDKLKSILADIPDIWAEQFESKDKKLDECGLTNPQETIRITKVDGPTITLLVGKQSDMKTRTVTRPALRDPRGMPSEPQQEVIHEEYRFAKLENNAQVFQIKADKLKDIFVGADVLRDARLARFRAEDARRVVIHFGGQDIVLAKEKDQWKVQKPFAASAEVSKVNDLLDKLAFLQARDKDVIDKPDLKAYQLAPPTGTIKVDVEENKGEGEAKTKTAKTFTFELGKEDKEKSKVYVRVEGWPRVNAVEDSLLTLVKRPALAYRGRRVLDFATADLAKIEVQRGGEKFLLEQVKDAWRLMSPVQVDADVSKSGQLAGDLSRLEAIEFVSNDPKLQDLEQYGLAKPAVSAVMTFTKADKPAQTLRIGKQRGDRPEYFAKLESAPAVFVVKKEIRELLDQPSLAYRPLQIWQVPQDEIVELRIQKQGQEQRLRHEGAGWQVVDPFTAPAVAAEVQSMLTDLATLRVERFEANVAKELSVYGLDKPYARAAVATKAPTKDGKSGKEASKEHVVLIGKPTAKDSKSRFAKLGDAEAIFVVGEKLIAAVERSPLDLLDRNLLALNAGMVSRIQSKAGGETLTIAREKDAWRVEIPTIKFTADPEAMRSFLAAWSTLRAERYAAYGPKANLTEYGLDKPTRAITVSLEAPSGKKPSAPTAHVLALGKPVSRDMGAVYARLDNGPGVVVLAPAVASDLNRDYLGFVDRTMLRFDAGAVTELGRRMGGEEVQVVKQNGWQLAKPASLPADGPNMDELVADLAALRAQRIAAYPAKDLKPFGLDAPAAVVKVRLAAAAGKPSEHVLRIGKPADDKQPASGDRFALADGSQTVGIISAALAKRLLAPSLQFRDRNLARFADVDRIEMVRGPRTVVFSKIEGTWKLTNPVQADAEQSDLEDFINALARLRADELIADNPSDLKPYGLDRPEVRWRFQSGEREVLDLRVGNAEKPSDKGKEPRRYAKLASGGLVFLLDAKLTAKALGEYRSRTVWPTLDAAQVETVRFGYPQDAFVLEKSENTWRVAGKQAIKVKPEAVSETLDALSRLRAERYVVDKDADLKLYGLEPPLLALEVQTPSGKRVLQIGRTAGDSTRHYARVPDDKEASIFLIAEAESAKIIRPLAAFMQPAGKPAPKVQ
jgi:hypothetical protein